MLLSWTNFVLFCFVFASIQITIPESLKIFIPFMKKKKESEFSLMCDSHDPMNSTLPVSSLHKIF